MTTLEIAVALAAVWGAVTGTVAVVLELVRHARGRPHLGLTCYLGRELGGPDPPGPLMLVYRVANDGGQAVTVTHLGGAGKDTIGLMIPAFEPRRMEPGDYLLSMAEPNLLEAAESLHVIDSLGRKWRLNRRVFARLKKDWLAKAAGADGHASASMR